MMASNKNYTFAVLFTLIVNLQSSQSFKNPWDFDVIKSREEQILDSWLSNVSLTVCEGQANVYFTPPTVGWHGILVQLRSGDADKSLRRDLNRTHISQLVNSNSGRARIHFADAEAFVCKPAQHCPGYYARVKVLSYSSTIACTDCKESQTPEGCRFYANGSVLPDMNICRSASSKELLDQDCPNRGHSSTLIIVVSVVPVVLLLAILAVCILAWKYWDKDSIFIMRDTSNLYSDYTSRLLESYRDSLTNHRSGPGAIQERVWV